MIIIFTYFYTAIMIDPREMADNLKRNGGFIPGVKPGSQTAEYIDSLMSKITLPGSIFLALIAILPAFAMQLDVKQGFSQFYGGTSLLIMVGVVLDGEAQVIMENQKTQETLFLKLGDQIDEAFIEIIEWNRITLRLKGQVFEISS